MRIAEIMADYHNIQNYIASVRTNPSAEEYNEDGYAVLRRCVSESQRLLAQPFHATGDIRGEHRAQLRQVLTDAAVRRFKAQKLYLQVTAALRWVNSRAAILQGQRPHARHAPALQQIRNTLRAVSTWSHRMSRGGQVAPRGSKFIDHSAMYQLGTMKYWTPVVLSHSIPFDA
nr:hypothetical protein CFP56_50841 [Quercus suber]